jgi:hypothetical protein
MNSKKIVNHLLSGTAHSSYQLTAPQTLRNRIPANGASFECRIEVSGQRLQSGERGLIISSPIELDGSKILLKSTDLDIQDLRSSLLFWDRLDCPSNNIFHISGVGAEADFLLQEGILTRSSAHIAGSRDASDSLRLAQAETFKAREQMEPGLWSVSFGENSIAFADEEMKSTGILFKLHKCLLVPDRTVPIQEVLEFKCRRNAELVALRHHLSDVYQKILSSPDSELAYCVEIERLEKALADEIRVAKENKFPFRLTDIRAKIDYGKVAKGVAIGYGSSLLGFPTIPALLAGAASGISIEQDVTLSLENSRKSPYEYVSLFHKELY